METILKKYKIPIAIALALALVLGLWQGFLLLMNHRQHSARRAAFAAALDGIDPANTAVSFRIPYESKLFTPQNIGLGQLDAEALEALDLLLTSMAYDKAANENSCFASENVQIATAVSQGRMTLSMGDDNFCVVRLTTDGEHWDTAVYTYDTTARDTLLTCGGLPSIAEMKAAIESDLQNNISNLGDLANVDDSLK